MSFPFRSHSLERYLASSFYEISRYFALAKNKPWIKYLNDVVIVQSRRLIVLVLVVVDDSKGSLGIVEIARHDYAIVIVGRTTIRA